MDKKQHYFVRLLGKRPGWPEDMTPEEEEIMGEHFEYLKKLVAEKRVVVAGPVWKPTFGLMILRVDSEDEAREIMKHEPSVSKGLHDYEMQEMILSLLMDNP
ncbi:MAG: YciI family protein [candidate division Zixibacteria bacterium]|nr:YciI family protein [candidate division Zixibacteria bacterium]